MRLEGLNQAIEGFQHESLKTPGTSFDQLMTSAWRLPLLTFKISNPEEVKSRSGKIHRLMKKNPESLS